jgi:hypothetical protein
LLEPQVPPVARSVGAMLARWAVAAGRADELRAQVAARRGKPPAEVPTLVLLALLAQAEGDAAASAASLGALGDALSKPSAESSALLASQAALPALADARPEVTRPAVAVLDRAIEVLAASPDNTTATALRRTLVRFDFAHGDPAAARRRLEAFVAVYKSGSAQSRQDLLMASLNQADLSACSEYLRAGRWAEALDTLKPPAVAPNSSLLSSRMIAALGAIARRAATAPPAERYERLAAWTIPTPERRSVRLLGDIGPEATVPPAVFGVQPDPLALADEYLSTVELLIAAARETNKLDELAAAARAADEAKVENGRALHILVEIARGQAASVEPLVRSFAAEPGQAAPSTAEVLVARACTAASALEDLGLEMTRALAERAREAAALPLQGLLDRDLTLADAKRNPGAMLRHWAAMNSYDTLTLRPPGRPGLWLVREGALERTGSRLGDWFELVYPLTGSFTFSCDAEFGPDTGVGFAYGGILAELNSRSSSSRGQPPTAFVRTLGTQESLQRPFPELPSQGPTRLTLEVSPEKIRFLIAGTLFHEMNRDAGAEPWLALCGRLHARTVVRNMQLTGKPVIPREVRLADGGRLDGWLCGLFRDSPPFGRALGTRATVLYGEPDWRFEGGQIVGRHIAVPSTNLPAQSRLAYHRPLRDRESVHHEFLYEHGRTLVHPSLGRLAFLLDPQGVRLHWMATDFDLESFGLVPDNVVMGNGTPLPLKPGEWNTMTVRLDGTNVVLVLNGAVIFEHPIEPSNDRLFGLYHDKYATEARVRNIVLTGPWPETVPVELLRETNH